jgi:hypothetical protein
MHSSYCCMACALDKLKELEDDNPFITSAKEQLALAISYAKQYDDTWHSIYWITAKAATKTRVRERLNHLAFDCYTALLASFDHINFYVEEVKTIRTPPTWWNDMIISLTLAYDAIEREHPQEISSRQLNIFEHHDMYFL